MQKRKVVQITLSYEDGTTETYSPRDAVLREGSTVPPTGRGRGTTPMKWGPPYRVYEVHWTTDQP